MKSQEKIRHTIKRLANKYLVVRSAIGLSFIFFAYQIFTKIHFNSDLGKLLMSFFGIVVLFLCLLLIAEFIIKTLWLEREVKIKRFSAVVSLNGLIGLVMPLFFLNLVLSSIVRYFATITNYHTIFCELRFSFINFYRMTHIYGQISDLVFWITLMLVALFLFGGLFEKVSGRK